RDAQDAPAPKRGLLDDRVWGPDARRGPRHAGPRASDDAVLRRLGWGDDRGRHGHGVRGCHDASDPHVLAMRRTVFPLSKGRRFEHGLSFLATLAFLGGFFGARLFHLAFPSLVVITQGIHFHHFWYGLAMMGVAGWLGIVDNDEKFARVYAVVFGVGAGFVGDEVGTKERLLTTHRARLPEFQRESEARRGNSREGHRYDNSRGPSPARTAGALGKEERG